MEAYKDYTPKARFTEDHRIDWESIRNETNTGYLFERDADSPAIEHLTQLYHASTKADGITAEDLGALRTLMNCMFRCTSAHKPL